MLQVNFLKEQRDRVLEGLKKRNFKNPEFVEYTADVSGIKEGTFPVFIKFTGERGKDLFLVDSFWFE